MKVTHEEIDRGFQDLGLSDEKIRQDLASLSQLTPPEVRPSYETVTAAHTSLEPKELTDAELESGS